MGEVICSVTYNQTQRRDLVLPDNIPVHQLVHSLARALGLPRSRETFYELHVPDGKEMRRIPDSRTLQQTFILNGGCLHLVSVKEDLKFTAFLVSKGGVEIRLRQSTIIGRLTPKVHVDVDLSPMDLATVVSRRHTVITHISSQYLIKDLSSHNGTFVNEVRLREAESLVLHDGDEICFGSLEKGVRLNFSAPGR